MAGTGRLQVYRAASATLDPSGPSTACTKSSLVFIKSLLAIGKQCRRKQTRAKAANAVGCREAMGTPLYASLRPRYAALRRSTPLYAAVPDKRISGLFQQEFAVARPALDWLLQLHQWLTLLFHHCRSASLHGRRRAGSYGEKRKTKRVAIWPPLYQGLPRSKGFRPCQTNA